MSAQEVIAELSRLKRSDLQEVDARLHELLRGRGHGEARTSWGEALLEVAGTARNLPEDFAHNHDHYLHGAPKR
jgi:hypothetical protein